MELLIPIGLPLFFIAIWRMMQLSIKIGQLRNGNDEAPGSIWMELAKGVSNHVLPGPYFSEFHDTEEIKRLIKKRNTVVTMFWAAFLIIIILNLIFKPSTPSNGLENLK